MCSNVGCSVLSDSLQPHELYNPWNSPGQNTGVGSLSLVRGIFPTQGLNPDLPHCRRILNQMSCQVVKETARNLINRALKIRRHLSNSWENWLSNCNWMPWVLSFLGPLLLTLILTFHPCLMHLFFFFFFFKISGPLTHLHQLNYSRAISNSLRLSKTSTPFKSP